MTMPARCASAFCASRSQCSEMFFLMKLISLVIPDRTLPRMSTLGSRILPQASFLWSEKASSKLFACETYNCVLVYWGVFDRRARWKCFTQLKMPNINT